MKIIWLKGYFGKILKICKKKFHVFCGYPLSYTVSFNESFFYTLYPPFIRTRLIRTNRALQDLLRLMALHNVFSCILFFFNPEDFLKLVRIDPDRYFKFLGWP